MASQGKRLGPRCPPKRECRTRATRRGQRPSSAAFSAPTEAPRSLIRQAPPHSRESMATITAPVYWRAQRELQDALERASGQSVQGSASEGVGSGIAAKSGAHTTMSAEEAAKALGIGRALATRPSLGMRTPTSESVAAF